MASKKLKHKIEFIANDSLAPPIKRGKRIKAKHLKNEKVELDTSLIKKSSAIKLSK